MMSGIEPILTTLNIYFLLNSVLILNTIWLDYMEYKELGWFWDDNWMYVVLFVFYLLFVPVFTIKRYREDGEKNGNLERK